MTPDHSSKIVLITGTSSGFGLLTATRLAQKGFKVIATMRNLDKQSALQSELNRRNTSAEILQCDVTDPHSINRCVEEIKNQYSHVDILINNAGYGVMGFFEDLTEEEIRAQMETNFFGVQNLTRKIIPLMRQRRRGKIINISSVSGFSSPPCFSAYSSSKFALEAFSEALHYELQLFGINVYLIQPGTYNTPIFHDNGKQSKDFNNPDSPYFKASKHIHTNMMSYVNDCHKDPEDIAILIEKIILGKKKSFRNIPDIEGKTLYLMRKFLPFSVFSWIVNKYTLSGCQKD